MWNVADNELRVVRFLVDVEWNAVRLIEWQMDFYFLKKLWCFVGGKDENKNLALSNELIKVELPP